MSAHVDIERQILNVVIERFPECPRCTSSVGYLTSWHDGEWLDLLMGFLPGLGGCRRRGGHFDVWCRRCYVVLATRAAMAGDER